MLYIKYIIYIKFINVVYINYFSGLRQAWLSKG